MRKPTRRERMNHVSGGLVCKVKGAIPMKCIVVINSEGARGGAQIRNWDSKRKAPVGKARYVPYRTFWDLYERLYIRIPKVGDVLERIGFGYCGPHVHVKVERVTKEPNGELTLHFISCKLGTSIDTEGGRRSSVYFNPSLFYEKFYILDTNLEKMRGIEKRV